VLKVLKETSIESMSDKVFFLPDFISFNSSDQRVAESHLVIMLCLDSIVDVGASLDQAKAVCPQYFKG
jgi:hypothetical protein